MKLLFTGLMAIGLLATPSATLSVAQAATEVALACPADAPDGWKRPNGYCEQRNTLDSIGTEKGTGGAGSKSDCMIITDMKFDVTAPLMGQLLVAGDIDPCCDEGAASPTRYLPDGMIARSDAIEVATSCY